MWRSPRPKRQLGWILIRRRAFQVRQNLRDDLRLLDAGNHPELPAAACAADGPRRGTLQLWVNQTGVDRTAYAIEIAVE